MTAHLDGPYRDRTPTYDLGAPSPTAGLVMAETHVWGCVRDSDGRAVSPTRSALHQRGHRGRRLLLNVEAANGAGMVMADAGGSSARGAPSVMAVADGSFALSSPPDADGRPWRLERNAGTLTWTEEGLVSLVGGSTGEPFTWSLDGDDDAALQYSLEVFEVNGIALDRAVHGFVGLDRISLPPGGSFYRTDPIARDHLLVAMFSFATRWDDDEVESGAFAVGHDGFGYAVVHRTGHASTTTTDVDAVVHRSDGYWPDRIELQFGEDAWEWIGSDSLRFTGYGRLENPQCDGLLRRCSETRSPLAWFAQGETVPSHGDRARRR